ncbi:MAG: benzoylformate decarboxylase [Solirubrobacterales bacterium]|nr:benzoylformate decarboxylase [Solirubrobacterales bacterium]
MAGTTTVREATLELLRRRGLTTLFGNPGSTELPMLADWPRDFSYVLGLQEAAVVCMADGFSQTAGRPVVVNLHTAPGVGNAVGSIITARWSRAPLVITGGQQVRAMITSSNWLVNADATRVPEPAVKWSFEPPRAQDVPLAIAKAIELAQAPPSGPVFVSIPMDDWDQEIDMREVDDLAARQVTHRAAPDPAALMALAEALDGARSPALVLGAAADQGGGWDDAVALAERTGVAVYAAPSAGRGVFPEDHERFAGFTPFAAEQIAQTFADHDLVLVVGAPAFTLYPYAPARLVPPGTRLVLVSDDPDEIARAPLGDAILADPALTLAQLVRAAGPANRPAPPKEPAPDPGRPSPGEDPTAEQVFAAVAGALPERVLLVNESPSNLRAYHRQILNRRSGGYLTTPSGGLGYGLAAAVGGAIADPGTPVLAIIGDGSLQYTVPALWTAARHRTPLVVLVMANAQYTILKAFGDFNGLDEDELPGLEVPGLDATLMARGYGVDARHVAYDDLQAAVAEGLAARRPLVLQVTISAEVPDLV